MSFDGACDDRCGTDRKAPARGAGGAPDRRRNRSSSAGRSASAAAAARARPAGRARTRSPQDRQMPSQSENYCAQSPTQCRAADVERGSRLWPALTRRAAVFTARSIGCLSLVLTSCGRAQAEHQKAGSADSNEPAGCRFWPRSTSIRPAGKGEQGDEQAHREADPAEQATCHRPAARWRHAGGWRSRAGRKARSHRKCRSACPGTSRRRCPAAAARGSGRTHIVQRDPGIGEAEQRDDRRRRPGGKPVLEPVKRR